MRRKSVLLLTILCFVLLCGCGKTGTPDAGDPVFQEPSGGERQPGKGQDNGAGQAQDNDGQNATDEDPDEEREAADGTNADGSDAGNLEAEEPAALTEEELQFFTEWIRKMENYGFLLSAYDMPEYVDLGEVFYSGAGIGEEMSEEEIAGYLAAYEQEELYTDCVKIPAQAMDAFLQRKLGIGLEDIESPFIWRYLPEFDSYYHEAGDTNYVSYDCVDGVREGDRYTLHFHTDWLWDDPRADCETVLRKSGGEYQFVSNCFSGGGESGYETMDPVVRAAYAAALRDLLEKLVALTTTYMAGMCETV